MALRATPTIAICLIAGTAAGVALARPSDTAPSAPAPAAAVAEATTAPDSPYLGNGVGPANKPGTDDNSDAGEAAAAPTPVAINIEGFAYSGATTVAPGTPIVVTNLDGAPHTVTATNGEFDTGNLGQNEQATFIAPTTPGTYEFFCVIHPSMVGQLTVG